MAYLNFNNAAITGMSACVPKRIVKNDSFSPVFSETESRKIIKSTGICERRFAAEDVCSSDLCFKAGDNLLREMEVERESIDILIFLSQTPDYIGVPATACLLQERLGLSKNTAAFDMVLGCSGFIYALSTAFAYVENPGINKVMVLCGETMSKFLSRKDKTTSLLFGDGAAAVLIEKRKSQSFFSLHTDGSGSDSIIIPAGGYRNMASLDSLESQLFDDGSERNQHHLAMDGLKVFDFTMREVIQDIKGLTAKFDLDLNLVDNLIFHQANKFIIDMFMKKLKLPAEKVPISIDRYGNTSAVSIPLTIVDARNRNDHFNPQNVILCGYGSGLSWGTVYCSLKDCHISTISEY